MRTNERANGAAEGTQRLALNHLEAHRTVWERFVEAQEDQEEFAQGVFEDALGSFSTEAERNLDAWQELVEQTRKGQEAARVFGRESARTYADFLDSLFFYYGESARAAERGTKQG